MIFKQNFDLNDLISVVSETNDFHQTILLFLEAKFRHALTNDSFEREAEISSPEISSSEISS